jgi:ketosteroid isomerase-like protein
MSQKNVDMAQRCIDAFDRRDVEAMRTLDHPDVELDFSASVGVDAGVYKGIDAVLRFFESYFDAFEEIAVNPDCFIGAGASVVVPNRSRSLGRDGVEVFARSTFVLTFGAGQLTRICLYQETGEALKAVGLAE